MVIGWLIQSNMELLNLIKQEADGFDCAAIEEIELALKAGAKPNEILYSGVYNRNEELAFALKANVNINLEGISQLKRLLLLKSKISKGLEMSEKQSFSEHTPKSKILDELKLFQKEKGLNKVEDAYFLTSSK